MPLSGLRVLDLSDHAGALCSSLLAQCGADVVRVEPLGGAPVRRLEPRRGGESLAHLYANRGKRRVEIDFATERGRAEIRTLAARADVVVDARAMALDPAYGAALLEPPPPGAVVVRITPFGADGPRAHWVGSDLVCAARGGMVFVNGHPDDVPLQPFGLAAYAATGLVGAVAALTALFARDRTGEGSVVDVSVAEAAAGAVEHVTGLGRQTGEVPRRQGTLHWSRTFRVGRARDGLVLLAHLGDWTTLVEWAASESSAGEALRRPEWEAVDARKRDAEEIFAVLDRWIEGGRVHEIVAGAALRRLPFAEVRRPERLADDEQLRVRGFAGTVVVHGTEVGLPGPPVRFGASRRRPASPPQTVRDAADLLTSWTPRVLPTDDSRCRRGKRPLDGMVVLDFTWVVAGPVATRTLADQGARVIKIEHRNAPDFGTRRGGLTGNLNRGKQSVVLDMDREEARRIAHDLAARADVVIDNFSARVMSAWGLDYDSLRRRRSDAIAVRLTGFGLDGPARDRVSYGPTLQALVGYPHLMRTPGGQPAGWGYSWSDMAAGWMGALAALAALRHRERTGEGRLVDVSQLETLVALLGPRVLDLLAGRAVDPIGNGSQEGARCPHGVYRCASDSGDDDRWLALSVANDAMWHRLAGVVVADGGRWARAAALETLPGREAHREEIDRGLSSWLRAQRAEDAEARLQERRVAAALVANGLDLLADAQLRHRGYFAEVAAPGEEAHEFDGVPFRSSSLPGGVMAPGPLCGEHTDSVLSQLLGLGPEEIQSLRDQEVIG